MLANLSKSEGKGPFHRRHQNITATQIFYWGTYFLTANMVPFTPSTYSKPFGTGCGYGQKMSCEKRKAVFPGQ